MGLLDSLMGDPETAGLLSGAAGMADASGPSLMPRSFGQVMSAGLRGAQDGYKNSLSLQQQNLKFQMEQQQLLQAVRQGKITGDVYQMISDRLHGGQPQQPDGGMPSQPAIAPPPASSMPMGSGFAGMAPPQPGDGQQAVQPRQAAPSNGGNFFGLNENGMMGGVLAGPAKLGEQIMSANAPTDFSKALTQAGIDPQSSQGQMLMQRQAQKMNYVAPIEARPGATTRDPFNPAKVLAYNPVLPEGVNPTFDDKGFVSGVGQIPGVQDAIAAQAKAKATGPASFDLKQVYNPGTRQMEFRPATDVAGAATGSAAGNSSMPAPMRNNNPGAMMPGGKMANYPDMQTGLNALDGNLQSYGKKGVNTIEGVINRWAPPNDNAPPEQRNDTKAYIADVSKRLGIPANQQIDLSNPAHRQALSTAIMLHENGSAGVFGKQSVQPTQPSGAMAAAPPLGTTTNADTAEKGGAEAMNASYGGLQKTRAGGRAALQDIDHMMALGSGKSVLSAGPLAEVAKIFSPNAAEYEKSRDNLVTQLSGQLGMNTDSAREMVMGSIPSYGAPKTAIQNGLQNLKNQVQLRMIKADAMTEPFNAGNSKTYNALENQFDQKIAPALAPVLSMPAGPKRAATLKLLRQNPDNEASLQWAASNGVLK